MGDWQGQHNIWFSNTASAQLLGHAVVDEDKLDAGVKDSFVVMALSEPSGSGACVPDWIQW